MNNSPLVSIIIPTFNRSRLIGETLDSVLAQTYQNWECIIVDDGSTDNTDEVVGNYVNKDPRFKYYLRPDTHKPGGNGARNYGFEISEGDYVQWFDDDDVMLEEYISARVMVFYDSIELVICSCYVVDEHLHILKKKDLSIQDYLFKDYSLWKLRIVTNNVMFKRGFLRESELFNENHLRGQETELFSRLFYNLSSEKFVLVDTPLFYYRQHQNTKSQKNKTFNKNFIKSLTLNSISNLRRGFELKDNEIINYHYRLAIHYLFEVIHNRDSKLGWYFLGKFVSVFKNYNRIFVFKLMTWIPLFICGGRTVYKVEKRFKNKIFQ